MEAAFQSGFASALLDVVFNRLIEFITKEAHNFKNIHQALRELETCLERAKQLLNRVDPFHGHNRLQYHADYLSSLCYDAVDLIDDLESKVKKHKVKSKDLVTHTVKQVKNLLKPHKLHTLLQNLNEVTQNFESYLDLCQSPVPPTKDIRTGLPPDIPKKLFGRDDDISYVVAELTNLKNLDSRGVSIVGMWGVGKTALAEIILTKTEVRATFPLILKVCMENGSCIGKTLDTLEVVYVYPNKRKGCSPRDLLDTPGRWLILIDSVSSDELDLNSWCDFQRHYLKEGRKVLVTTQNHQVAEITQTTVHRLKPISDDDCGSLFAREFASLNNGRSISISSSDQAEISRNSYGLPSVAKLLAMYHGRFGKVVTDLWTSQAFKNEILPKLRSSFQNLKPDLKRCFIYFSLFPRGYKYDMEDLILLWIGEGMVQHGTSSLEEKSREYFDDLLNQSILQPLHITNMYEMHEITHYITQVAGSKVFVLWKGGAFSSCGCNMSTTCHLSFNQNVEDSVWDEIKKLRSLRTFMSLYTDNIGHISKIPRDLFSRISRLRVLVLNKTNVDELPGSIKELKYLRHLDISYTSIKRLPDELSKLLTLQILKFKKHDGIPQLPKKFTELTKLAFIDWEKSDLRKLQSKPRNIGELISIRTLPLFVVENRKGYGVAELMNMDCIQGSLCISNLENINNEADAQEAMLSNKRYLTRLELQWVKKVNNAREVMAGLKPNDKLRELRVVNYLSDTFPQWLSADNACLPELETLEFKECCCRNMPALGQLPALKNLHLEDMSKIRSLDHHFRGANTSTTVACFASLESLLISNMEELEQWTTLEVNDMPRLRNLNISNCPMLKTLPPFSHLTSLVELNIEYCQSLRSLPDLPASLQSLIIRGSDNVKKRCQVGAKDWSKIVGISVVTIDGERISTSDKQNDIIPSVKLENIFSQVPQLIWKFLKSIFGGM